jgi:actin-related protein
MNRFAAGKPTALIVDVGYANTSTVPVVDGYALRAGTSTQSFKS